MKKRIRVKPGKGQSAVGFVGGIIFCLIGLFFVIPTFGIFGVFWTIIAVVITISNAASAFTDRGYASHEIIIEDDEERFETSRQGMGNQEYTVNKTVEERLTELESLYHKGLIRAAEYEKKREEILKDI